MANNIISMLSKRFGEVRSNSLSLMQLAPFQKGGVIYYNILYIVLLSGEWKEGYIQSKTQNRRMASKSSTIRLLCFCYFMLFSFMHFSSCTVFSLKSHASTCNGSIAECNQEDELLMESEISRRFLEQKRSYISNGALQRDKPVCNGGGSGEAYSKTGGCLPPPSNPQNRGCSKYYRCRSDS